MTDEPREATCPTCKSGEYYVRNITSVLHGERGAFKARPCGHTWHDKPPDKPEWMRLIWKIGFVCSCSTECNHAQIPEGMKEEACASVQRALDERAAHAYNGAAAKVKKEYGTGRMRMTSLRNIRTWCLNKAAAAEARGEEERWRLTTLSQRRCRRLMRRVLYAERGAERNANYQRTAKEDIANTGPATGSPANWRR